MIRLTSITGILLPLGMLVSTPAEAGAARAPVVSVQDSVAVTVRVLGDSAARSPLELAIVRSGTRAAQTDSDGRAVLRLPVGNHWIVAARIGFLPDSARVELVAGRDASVEIVLVAQPQLIQGVIVSATRTERRVEDTPLRVEVIDQEEISEKVAMSPGDIAMMLAETGGLRVQTTNPSLGGANVRIQGLRGRYSLLLADGLPLYGQTGGLGLLQIPPVDLGRVEVIKGTASALYGSAALGGVINLVARQPGDEPEHSLLANQTSRGGTDAVYFGATPLGDAHGLTLLAGAHTQRRNDIDTDGWTDMPGFDRVVLRPRAYLGFGTGRSVYLTAGATTESRRGGTLPGHVTPEGNPHLEALRTRRYDVGGVARIAISNDASSWLRGSVLTARGSLMQQRHRHQFGPALENDRHETAFGEVALAIPHVFGARAATYLLGAAYQLDAYHNDDVSNLNYQFNIPSVFAQADIDLATWLSASASARLDAHSDYGTFVNPRFSLLLRPRRESDWTARLSGGSGSFAPTPFTEETEATGLSVLMPLTALRAERAQGASIDIGGPVSSDIGEWEFNVTGFASRVHNALQLTDDLLQTPTPDAKLALVNAPSPTSTWGGELLARMTRELGDGEESPALRITGSYTWLRSRECDTEAAQQEPCVRREVPLTPRHAIGVVASIEQEERGRIGFELYYTGEQHLELNPYRATSPSYVLMGVLMEYSVPVRSSVARFFLNLENLTNVRQTRYDPLALPAPSPGGRWTTDAWTDLAGFTANGGVRFTF